MKKTLKVNHYQPALKSNVNITVDRTEPAERLKQARKEPKKHGRKLTVIRPQFSKVWKTQKAYTDYDENMDCKPIDIKVLVKRAYNTYVTEYIDNRTERPAPTSQDPQSVIDLATACCTSMLRKGVTPKMITIYEQRHSYRKQDFDDIVSTFLSACFEKSLDSQHFDIDVDVTETIHNAFLACYRYMYSIGTTGQRKTGLQSNVRYAMDSVDKLIDDNDSGLSTLDKGLIYFALFDNRVDTNYIISDGLTVNKKALSHFANRVQDKLTERQKSVMHYYFDGLSVRSIADIISIGKSTVSRDIHFILDVVKEQAEFDGLTITESYVGYYRPRTAQRKLDRYAPARTVTTKDGDDAMYQLWMAQHNVFNHR